MDGSFSDEQVHLWLQEVADASWVSLHFDTPALGGVGANEIFGGGYVRVKGIFTQPSNRIIWLQEDIRWSGLTPNILTHFGIWNDPNQGMLRSWGRLPKKTQVLNGWGYQLHQGDLAISMG
jgi:hypothetical protein